MRSSVLMITHTITPIIVAAVTKTPTHDNTIEAVRSLIACRGCDSARRLATTVRGHALTDSVTL